MLTIHFFTFSHFFAHLLSSIFITSLMYLASLSCSSTAILLHPASLCEMYAGVFLLIPMAIFTYLACSIFNCSLLRHSHISTPHSIPVLASHCIRKSFILRLLIRAFLNIPYVAFIAFINFMSVKFETFQSCNGFPTTSSRNDKKVT